MCAAACGAGPQPRWRVSLGSDATITNTGGPQNSEGVLVSPDNATVYATFFARSVRYTYTPQVLALRTATGEASWSWTPTLASGAAYEAVASGNSVSLLSSDGSTLFILIQTQNADIKLLAAAVRAATGAVLWKLELHYAFNPVPVGFNASLPALSARGDLCLMVAAAVVACLDPATGETRCWPT